MPRLLFVDDDKKMLEVMKEYLFWYGFKVATLDKSGEIIDWLKKDSYDLLLYNIFMEKNGFDFCRRIRESADPRVSQAGILIFASEPLELEDYVALRQLKLYFINKYENIEEWLKKINLILRQKTDKLTLFREKGN